MAARFNKEELNSMIIEDLGDRVAWNSERTSKTLLLDLENPRRKLRIYVFNCTCRPGARLARRSCAAPSRRPRPR